MGTTGQTTKEIYDEGIKHAWGYLAATPLGAKWKCTCDRGPQKQTTANSDSRSAPGSDQFGGCFPAASAGPYNSFGFAASLEMKNSPCKSSVITWQGSAR
mmetsp:Transcript_118115/g.204390  ORF Transcript_118115/g.204390 Transcript_118115/m.204390 type:complete len:100 (+) Transcript_118115:1432-1731(+)